ncbi:MAG: hypothetical protein CV087_22125 [Candidatus Brocadia sp. WS118]|nr:MAG: hypothetical protein CV087_22125 [Candidatus Brocadia sp. WS118]
MITAGIIDDDRQTVEVFAEYLEMCKVNVVARGYDGKDAVEIYKKLKPDIIFLDLAMPVYDGIYALSEIRASDKDAKVVIVTADLKKELEERMQELKPTEVLIKPFDVEKILAILGKIATPVPMPSDRTKNALVSFTIEQALLEIGQSAVDEVGSRLYEKHGCYFSDCLEHPEYLSEILGEIFGSSHVAIVRSIGERLAEFEDQQPFSHFLFTIGSKIAK